MSTLMSTYKKAKPSSDIPNWVYGMSDRMGLSVWAKVGVGVGVRRGSTHYYNFENGLSVWTGKFRPEWIKFYDMKYKDYYYANQFTGECMWEEPENYIKPANKTILKFLVVNKELKSALAIQHAFRAQQARRHAYIEIARYHAHTAFFNWVTITDPKSGCEYYFNIETNVGPLWEKPAELEEAELATPTWCKVYDPRKTMYYYYNNYTGIMQWSVPDDYRDPPRASIMAGSFMSDELKAAICIQNAYRAKQSRRVALLQRAKHDPDGKAIRGWVKEFSKFHDCEYFVHVDTGEIMWEKPEAILEYEATTMPEWVELYDPSHGKYYFFNNLTNESVWDRPEEYFTPRNKSADFLKHVALNPRVKAALIIQGAYRRKKARERLRIKKAQNDSSHSHNGWVTEVDRMSGETYYYHVDSGLVQWEKPEILGAGHEGQDEWVKIYSPADKKYYYYSNWTREVTWDRPAEYKDPPKGGAALKHFAMNKEVKAAICIQHAFRAKLARQMARLEKAKRHNNDQHNGWVTEHDAFTGKDYYWNIHTREVSWELPKELGGGPLAGIIEWVKVFSPRDDRYYYYNNYTEECTFDKPDDFNESLNALGKMSMSQEMRSAIKIQNLFRAKLAREELRKKKVQNGKGEPFRGWVTEHDRFSGKDYYWNVETREVTWEKPSILLVPRWVKMYDPESKWHYYVNNDTGENTWERPDDYEEPAPGSVFKNFCINKEVKAALTIQSAYRSRQAMLLTYAIAAQKNGDEGTHGWLEAYTHSGEVFFWKIGTKRVTFRRPRVLGGGEKGGGDHLDGFETKAYEPSEQYAARAVELQNRLDEDNYDMKAKVELGRLYADDGNYELSIETTKAALNGGVDNHKAYGALGKAYYLLWEKHCDYAHLNQAFDAFRKMAQRHLKPDPNCLFYMARCYEGFGSYESAVKLLGDIIVEFPEYEEFDEVVFHAAVILKHLKQYDVAQDYLAYLASRKESKITPELIWFQVAHCFHLQGKDELAQEGLDHLYFIHRFEFRKKGIKTGSQWATEPSTWLQMAKELMEHHLYLMAADSFKHAIFRSDPYDVLPETLLDLSHCLHRSHNRQEAIEVLRSAMEIYGDNEMVQHAYEQLSAEYAARVRAEAAAAMLIQNVLRGKIARRRVAKIQARIAMIEESKVHENLKKLMKRKTDKLFLGWRDHVKYVTSIRHFAEKIIGHGKRRFFDAWVNSLPAFRRENMVREANASIIQRCYRAYMVRTLVTRYLNHRRFQEEQVRRARKTREIGIQRIIMNRWHIYSEKCERARATYRRMLQRKMVAAFNEWKGKYYQKQTDKWNAAIKIQTRIRICIAMKELQRLKDLRDFLIRMIQARIRAKIARTRVKIAKWKKQIVFRRAATKIQALVRGYLCRGYIWGHMTHAAITIQALWRNHKWRNDRRKATLVIQRYYESYKCDKVLLENYCAMKIAAVYRGHLARRWVRMNRASTNISKVYRGHVARLQMKALRKRLQTFWANILFEEFDARTTRTIKQERMSPLRQKILKQQGQAVPPTTSRAIYDGDRLRKEIWERFPAANLARLQQIKPVPMPQLVVDDNNNNKSNVIWKHKLSKPVYGDDDPARHPSKLPIVEKIPTNNEKAEPIDPLSETSLLGAGVIHANYLVPRTPNEIIQQRRRKKFQKKKGSTIPRASKKTLREKKRLLPLTSDRDASDSITTKAIINSGDVNLLKSFAKLQSKLSPGSLTPLRRRKRSTRRRR